MSKSLPLMSRRMCYDGRRLRGLILTVTKLTGETVHESTHWTVSSKEILSKIDFYPIFTKYHHQLSDPTSQLDGRRRWMINKFEPVQIRDIPKE